MKQTVKKLLARCGYQLVPVDRPAAAPPPSFPVARSEVEELQEELVTFAKHSPECTPWSEPEHARSYLNDRRLGFYHEVLDVCRRHGVDFDDRDIADVGSGPGYLMRLIARESRPRSLTGYDTYRTLTALARFLCPPAQFVDADLFDVEGVRFDVVFATEILEHLIRPDQALDRLLRLLRDDGFLVLTVPDGRTDTFAASTRLENGRGYWGHINFWSPESWSVFIEIHSGARPFCCGRLSTGENYAIIRNHTAPPRTGADGQRSASRTDAATVATSGRGDPHA